MTREEAIYYLQSSGFSEEQIATVEQAFKQEPSDDLISRDAVIEIIHLFFTEEVDKIPTKKTEDGEVLVIRKCQPLFEMNKAICKRIKALPSVPQEPKWIPVSERMPDIHNYCMKYLVTDSHSHIHTSLFIESDGKGWWSCEDVIAWMPLPEPYEPKESEEA